MTDTKSVSTRAECVNSFNNKNKSHYSYWHYSKNKIPFPVNNPKKFGYKTDLIGTTFFNPSKNSEAVHLLSLDLDFDKVTDTSFIKDKKIGWCAVKKYLEKNHSYLLGHIFAVTRSYGGRGLSILFSISPMRYRAKNASPEKAALALLSKLHDAFEKAGCGVDRAATGLKRLCTNWKLKEKRLYFRPDIKKKTEKERRPVVTSLLKKMNKDPLLCYKKKSDQLETLLCVDIRKEKKLALLFEELLDNDYTLQKSVPELQKLTGMSQPTLRETLKKPPKWLITKWINKYEGWDLALCLPLISKYTPRVKELSNPEKEASINPKANNFKVVELKEPFYVKKGERNEQITNWLLRLKWFGIEYNRALNHVIYLANQIEDQSKSRNLGESNIIRKAKSIYFSPSHEKTFGCFPKNYDFPEWLQAKKEKTKKLLEAPLREHQVKGLPEFPSKYSPKDLKTVSIDRHFMYKSRKRRNKKGKLVTDFSYYSVPCWAGKKVIVLQDGDALNIFSLSKKTFLYRHKITKKSKEYITEPKHLEGLSLDWYLRGLEEKYDSKDLGRWKYFYQVFGFKAYRKIQEQKRSYDQIGRK